MSQKFLYCEFIHYITFMRIREGQMVIRSILMLAVCMVIMLVSGNAVAGIIRIKKVRPAQKLYIGFFTICALYELIYIPLMMQDKPLILLTILWGVAVFLLFLAGAVIYRRELSESISEIINMVYRIKPAHIIAVIAVVAYLIIAILNQAEYQDDAFFVAMASTSYSTNTIIHYDPYTGRLVALKEIAKYLLSAYPVMIASLSQMSGLHVLVIMHIMIPVAVILLHYSLVYTIAKKIFQKDIIACKVVIVATIINLFSLYSAVEMTTSGWLYLGAWYGKSLIGNIIVPALWYYLIMAIEKSSKYWIIIFLIHSAAVNFSTYGSIAAISVTACITLYYMIKKQKISYSLMAIVASMPSVSTALMTYITTFKK